MKETFKFNLKIDKTDRYLFIITAVLVGLGAFGSYYFGFLNKQNANTSFFVKLFDLNTEGNFPTLFSTLLLGGYNGSVCATRFGVTVPPVPVQTVPVFQTGFRFDLCHC